jgi:energy-coupling factor transporter ATP-binding protein EcfA2
MAEGYRKLAMLIFLLRYGVLERGSTLFWDEPEANLNPAATKLLAAALYALAGDGVQVIVATHSLFLLREFEILQMQSSRDQACRAQPILCIGAAARAARSCESECRHCRHTTAGLLDENLLQSDRYMESVE